MRAPATTEDWSERGACSSPAPENPIPFPTRRHVMPKGGGVLDGHRDDVSGFSALLRNGWSTHQSPRTTSTSRCPRAAGFIRILPRVLADNIFFPRSAAATRRRASRRSTASGAIGPSGGRAQVIAEAARKPDSDTSSRCRRAAALVATPRRVPRQRPAMRRPAAKCSSARGVGEFVSCNETDPAAKCSSAVWRRRRLCEERGPATKQVLRRSAVRVLRVG